MAQQTSGHSGHSGPSDVHEESHGHSVASWVLVAIELVGTFIVCLAIVLTLWWMAIVGVVICVIGVVAGRLLQMAGFGVHPPSART